MKEGIIVYTKEDGDKNRFFIDLCLQKLNDKNFSLTYITEDQLEDYLSNHQLSYAIYRGRNYILSEKLVSLNLRVFNCPLTNQIANDKYLSIKLFEKLELPTIQTEILPDKFDYPYIMKSVDGHGGREVFLITGQEKYLEVISRYSNKRFIFQPYILNDGDVRMYLINKKIVACVNRTSDKDFRHNYSLGGQIALYQPSEALIKEAEAIAQQLDADYIGIDVLLVDDSYLFNEIEDPVGARMLYQLSELDIVSLFIDFVKQKLS